MAYTINGLTQGAATDAGRTRFFLLDRGDPGRANAVDFSLIKARTQDHVGIQRQRRLKIFLQRGNKNAAAIEIGTGADVGTQRLGAITETKRIVLTGTFVEHAHGEVGDAGFAALVGGEARALEGHAELHHRQTRAFGQDHAGTVAERGTLQRREFQIRETGGFRHARFAVKIGCDRAEFWIGFRNDRRGQIGHRRLFNHRRALARYDAQGVIAGGQPFSGD